MCLWEDCSLGRRMYSTRHEWLQHEQNYHGKAWTCRLGCSNPFSDRQSIQGHYLSDHSAQTQYQIEKVLQASEISRSDTGPYTCPLCSTMVSTTKAYAKHAGRHLRELSLFALPAYAIDDVLADDDSLADEDSENESERDASGEIRLRIDASAPLSLSFNNEMEGRNIQINPAEDDTAELVIPSPRGIKNTYRSESVIADKALAEAKAAAEEEVAKLKPADIQIEGSPLPDRVESDAENGEYNPTTRHDIERFAQRNESDPDVRTKQYSPTPSPRRSPRGHSRHFPSELDIDAGIAELKLERAELRRSQLQSAHDRRDESVSHMELEHFLRQKEQKAIEEKINKAKENEEYERFLRIQEPRVIEEKEKKEAAEKQLDDEMRKRLAELGFQQHQIKAMLELEGATTPKQNSSPNNPLQLAHPPTYVKVHRDHLSIETLVYYDLPYEVDRVGHNRLACPNSKLTA
jgi:hypothetical protein